MPNSPDLARLAALADALDVLARLHDREVDAVLVAALRLAEIPDMLAETLEGAEGQAAAANFALALAGLPDPVTGAALDLLAAEFADIYLTHAFRASPSGSVWLTEEHLERQEPMFEVREFYGHYDIQVPDWRRRADDHLVHELEFVSFLLHLGDPVAAADAARFLDLHLLPWLPAFCDRARPFLTQPVYRALFDLTLAVVEEVRAELEALLDAPRAVCDLPGKATAAPGAESEAYVPGLAESW